MPQTTPLLMDVDTGLDDALALAFVAREPRLDLLAITCVAGNTTVDNAIANTLGVLDALDISELPPVGRGSATPLIAPARSAHGFHGPDGLGGLGLGRVETPAQLPHAVELIRDTILNSSRPPTLLALGPLTNVALLIRSYPEVAAKLERIVFMGGSMTIGNATPVAEFNAWHDPEAAAIVCSSGIPTTMYGLDVFHQPRINSTLIKTLAESADPARAVVGKLLHAYAHAGDPDTASPSAALGDAGAAVMIAAPNLVNTARFPVSIELSGASRGQTIVDRRRRPGEGELHGTTAAFRALDVCVSVTADALADRFLQALTGGIG